ncbi:MAG TPA: hypothetical protein VJT71_11595 [Pyrinomonadaceae bacterium]|nr:hypothetical protein [Pyrinomonadaceae bacterium]
MAAVLAASVPASLRRLRRVGYSNFDEEKILAAYIEKFLPAKGRHTAVDLGAGDGVRHSNTHALYESGWRGLVVDSDSDRVSKLARNYRGFEEVFASRCRVTPSNVIALLEAYETPKEFEVLSLDIDSYDYWVLDSLLNHFRPRIIVSEINEKIPPPIEFVVSYDPAFVLQHHFYGHSLASLEQLCIRHEYALIDLEYNNAFLAPRELRGARHVDAMTAYRHGYLERPDRLKKFPLNRDMELLHNMTPPDAVAYLDKFFARHKGKYQLSAGKL